MSSFVDKARIHLHAGKGGDGAVAFHREKYIAAGGPDGGDGGRGGSVVFIPDDNMTTLMDFQYKRKYTAADGANGQGKRCAGKDGADLQVRVPRGTLIRDTESGSIMHDMSDGKPFVAAKGGRGGWGNMHFATPTRQVPRFAKPGLPGEIRDVTLELNFLESNDVCRMYLFDGEAFDPGSTDGVWVDKEFAEAWLNVEHQIQLSKAAFEQKKAEAFEGSDYYYEENGDTTLEDIFYTIVGVCMMFLSIFPVFIGIWQIIKTFLARRKRDKEVTWYREIPVNGNLHVANDIINDYKYIGGDYKKLLSASILQLINMGAISVEWHTNAKGKMEQRFAVHDYQFKDTDAKLLKILHGIFLTAAGSDRILEPQELKAYMKDERYDKTINTFIEKLREKTKKYKTKDFKAMHDDAMKVFGLKKFLKDFTLMDERHLQEVALWKNYMVWAALFGISDQVIKDMKKVNPEYFNMDQVAGQMADNMTLPMINSVLNSSTSSYLAHKAGENARYSGGGGHSSWGGGGGGFHGGGGGGGIR